eukprot:5754757-Prymnesium_polylepis.1
MASTADAPTSLPKAARARLRYDGVECSLASTTSAESSCSAKSCAAPDRTSSATPSATPVCANAKGRPRMPAPTIVLTSEVTEADQEAGICLPCCALACAVLCAAQEREAMIQVSC